jgi:DNA-binding response OmpR family regulator
LSRVLIIHDDDATTDSLRPILEQEMYEVITAHPGKDGIEAASQQDLSVVILDLLMPDSNEWEVCRAVRKTNPAPIIFLSAMNKPGLIARALDAGADEFLVKPVPANRLLAHLKRLSKRAQAEKDASARHHYRPKSDNQAKIL